MNINSERDRFYCLSNPKIFVNALFTGQLTVFAMILSCPDALNQQKSGHVYLGPFGRGLVERTRRTGCGW